MPGSNIEIDDGIKEPLLKVISREALKILFSKAGALACVGFSGATLVAVSEAGLEAAGLPPELLALVMEVLVTASSTTLGGKILISAFRPDRKPLADMTRREGKANHGSFGRHKPDF